MSWPAVHEAQRPALEAAWAKFEQLIDPDFGPIQEVTETDTLPGEPAFAGAVARLARLDHLYPLPHYEPLGGSTCLDPLEARVRAVGEAIERLGGFLCFPAELPRAKAAELSGALAPARWPRCSDQEYRHRHNGLTPPRAEQTYHWVAGQSLTHGRPAYLPANHVYLSYLPPNRDELTIWPHSTGLAAGASFEAATLSGALEVIERDAVALTWFKGLAPPQLNLEGCPWPEVNERLRRLTAAGLRVAAYALLPDDPPPKRSVLLWDRPGGPLPLATGAGVATTVRRALAKALDEALQGRETGLESFILHKPKRRPPRSPQQVIELEDHLTFYLNPKHLVAFDFFNEGGTIELEQLPELGGLDHLTQWLADAGYELFSVDLTPPEARAVGLFVVRALIPGYLPLAHGDAIRFLAMERWGRYPGQQRPWPHPFG